ncbi:MAG TPA: hypothetical protein VJ729_13695 [Nitrososphaeraceae archaeon]|nr:hypothetical protein [Nitrososphaeraceae archaeon]
MNRPFHSAYVSALCRVMITLFVLELVIIINNGYNYYEAFAVRNTSPLTTTEPTLSSVSKGDDTFSAVGTINSLIITVPETGFNVSNAFKVIVSGDWTLNVHNGNVTYFSANLLASPMDAIQPHTHQITNFKPENDRIQLTPDTSLSLNGTVDVKVNGLTMWKNVHSSILISKSNIMSISLDDKETNGHFGKQPIFGLVTRLMVY